MSLNKNLKTRRKQLAILAAVIVGGAAATSGVIWYGQHQQEQKHPAPVATPNMTGVVTAAFNQQVNDAALAQQQAKTSALEDKLATLTQQFAQNKLTTEQQLAKKDEEIQRLNDQLTKAPGSNTTTGQQTPPAGQNGTPLPGPVAAGQARPPEYTVTPTGAPAATGVNMGQGAGFYPGGSGQRMTGGLSTTKFSYESLKKKPTKLPWIPSGSFSDAILIEGADANASVTGQQNTQPVTIRLLGNIQMPNNKEYSADGCFVVGEIWGDISSERGVVRTKTISCVLKNGKHVDMEFDGHVSYQGKGGVRGKPVIRLKGENGRVTINPEKVRAQQHLDYGWAVTGYGAQGASSDYVIALEGTKDGRKALASRRAFYISASRVKEHVQIYTDGKADWVKAVKTPERDIKTAHDALAPETQRKQAKAIWAMGQPVNKTAIGRAWVRHQGMQDASLTAKIIPATRRFPEPALALPVYDNNGRSAGLALVSLVASPEGRMTQGETRMVMTERARGAVLQRSQSGNTIVASDLTAALDAVRNNPKDGVVWQTGDEPPSAWLLKVSGGTKQDVSPGIVSTLTDEQSVQQLREQMLADLVRNEEASRSRQPESLLAEVPQEEVIRLKPEGINPRKPEPLNPDADVIARVRGEENTDGREIKAAAGVRSELEGADKASGEQSRASRVIADLANAERDMLRAAENTERGRTPEREEQTLTRTIQKER
ncbi:hypothetical protein EKN74_25135 [Enterobacter ludwigii]|nr:conjugative transfer relaxase/helicase TraI domain-containing protein [Enterobacter ludwigii]RTO43601.1 hypothetical protein EKN74_25135 [Enterobacter ludwigii]